MAWTETTPTEEEKALLPEIGSHWINRKIERAILAEKSISQITHKHLEIIITGFNWRDDEVENSLQIDYCLAVDPENSNLFMVSLDVFDKEYRPK